MAVDAAILENLLKQSWRAAGAPSAVLLAVSGGGDSAALLRICARLSSSGVKIAAATVDHGLRPEAAREAEVVAGWCAALNVPHATLAWVDEKQSSGLQAAARSARYRLLARHAGAIGAGAIFTAHTQDDVAETFLMRLARGAGAEGLAEMARESLIADGAAAPVALLRPWLDVTRADLRNFLASISAPFMDDPSNDDDQFERVRMRRLMPQLALDAGIETAALARSARRLVGAARCRRIEVQAAFNHAGGVFHHWGGASLSASALASSTMSPALCARLVHAVSGGDYPPSEDQATAALDAVLKTARASLGGAIIEILNDRIWFYREPAALTGRAGVAPLAPMRLAVGERAIWDGRFIVAVEEDCEILPAGLLEQEVAAMPAASLFDGPSAALASLPTIRRGDLRTAFIPAITPQSGVTCRSLAAERFAGEVNRF